jgi:hypothetical protein
MHFSKLTIDERLVIGSTTITNGMVDKEIRKNTAEFGYRQEHFDNALVILEKAQKLHHAQQWAQNDKEIATIALKEIFAEAKKKYMVCRKVARMLFGKDAPVKKTLGLEGLSKRSVAEWVEEAKNFYTNALGSEPILEKLSGFGITRETLEEGQKLVADVEKAQAYQEKKKGEAIAATEARDKALKELEDWVTSFWKVCRIAMGDQPGYRVKLEMKLRSKPLKGDGTQPKKV